MKKSLRVQELLVSQTMYAGEILKELNDDTMAQAIENLMGAIEIRGGNLDSPLVLLCKKAMSEELIKLTPTLESITTDQLLDKDEFLRSLVCVVTDEEKFPEHYVILTDAEQLKRFMNEGITPHSALIAVKGFTTTKNIVSEYVAHNMNDLVWEIIAKVADQEFAEREHDQLRSITLHSDFMLMTMIYEGVVNENRVFLNTVPVKMKYDATKRTSILLEFKNGVSITLSTKKDIEKNDTTQKLADNLKNGMLSAVLEGQFGK